MIDDRTLLFLAHRIPYPPDKGDKIRSWHILRHLAARHRVYLGCFFDDIRDRRHEAMLRDLCADCCLVHLDPVRARLRSLWGLLSGLPLTLPYYHHSRLVRWVDDIARRRNLERIFVFSSAMAQYVCKPAGVAARTVVDFVDVDSEKWREYGEHRSWPASWVYGREARTLLRFERDVAGRAAVSTFVSRVEADLFRRLAPEASGRVDWVANGVDCDFFTPDRAYEDPFPGDGPVLVFTGAMDYWPNVDAVTFFAREVLPAVQARVPKARFCIVGANPGPGVSALAGVHGVQVTGYVADVRPYLAHAAAVVAPLRIARGIQNKVLEAMAMGRPTVATPQAMAGIEAEPGHQILMGADAASFAEAVIGALEDPASADIGGAARASVLSLHNWQASLGKLDALLDRGCP